MGNQSKTCVHARRGSEKISWKKEPERYGFMDGFTPPAFRIERAKRARYSRDRPRDDAQKRLRAHPRARGGRPRLRTRPPRRRGRRIEGPRARKNRKKGSARVMTTQRARPLPRRRPPRRSRSRRSSRCRASRSEEKRPTRPRVCRTRARTRQRASPRTRTRTTRPRPRSATLRAKDMARRGSVRSPRPPPPRLPPARRSRCRACAPNASRSPRRSRI